MARKLTVRVSFNVEIEVADPETDLGFFIEENGCPGTGPVGAAVSAMVEDETGMCLFCDPKVDGKNRILSVDGVPWKPKRAAPVKPIQPRDDDNSFTVV